MAILRDELEIGAKYLWPNRHLPTELGVMQIERFALLIKINKADEEAFFFPPLERMGLV